VTLLLASGAGLISAEADSLSGPSFDATANAYGVDAVLSTTSLPLGLNPEGAGPVAQAHLNSLGQSDAFASSPYPGDTAENAPGLANALIPVQIVPEYPLIASTQAGDDPRTVAFPGITLSARSGASLAQATGITGETSTGGTSTARVEQSGDGSVTAEGDANFNGLVLGPELTVSSVESEAKVVADGYSGKLTKTEKLTIGHISVPGLNLTLPTTSPSSLPLLNPIPGLPQPPQITLPTFPVPLGGTTISAPDLGLEDGQFVIHSPIGGTTQTYAVPTAAVVTALAAAGITLTVQQPQDLTTGIEAGGVTFSYEVAAPPSNPLYNGPTRATFSLGRSIAMVTLNPVQSDSTSAGDTTTGFATGRAAPTPSGTSSPTSLSPATAPAATVGTGQALAGPGTTSLPGALAGSTSSSSGGASTPPQVAGTAPPTVTSAAADALDLAGDRGPDTGNIYLILVGVAVLALLVGTVFRLRGVRLLWIS
jgi:hypothetical protein